MSPLIELRDVRYSYGRGDVLCGLSLSVEEGSFTSVTGDSGAGKSTFARLLNALLVPGSGKVIIGGADTSDSKKVHDIRRCVSLVFQNPDNSIIGDTVADDVAFGPENMGLPVAEIKERVRESLSLVGLEGLEDADPNCLSGGQKQLLAIAGALAIRPRCIVLDEGTVMLDPKGRKAVLSVLHRLNKERGMTVVLITRDSDEIAQSDVVHVFEKGRVVFSGSPEEAFGKGVLRSPVSDLKKALDNQGISVPDSVVSRQALADYLTSLGGRRA